MIESVLVLTSLNLAVNLPIPMVGGVPMLFLFMVSFGAMVSLIPTLLVSVVAAILSERSTALKKE